jgi:preprotein translocase subunit SecG
LLILFMTIQLLLNYAAKYKDKDNRDHRLSGLSSCYA